MILTMKTREDFIKSLRENPQYREALGRARNVEERKAISRIVEGFVGSFAGVLGPAIEQAEQDPTFAAKLGRALVEKQDVLNKSQQPTSGSNT
jgi:hypothetical protein